MLTDYEELCSYILYMWQHNYNPNVTLPNLLRRASN
jgi:hypothetical protein